jgi:signal transduction histidine kinase
MSERSADAAPSLQQLQARYMRLLERLEANEREFRRLGRAVWNVQEDERRRLARELHDGLGQNLTALANRLVRLRDALEGDAAALRQQADEAIALCRGSLEDTRQLSRLLRPPILDDLGLEAALHWLARSVHDSGSMAVVTEFEPLPALEGEVQTLLFRVAQEALTNAARHASAQSVLLRVAQRDGAVHLQAIDDGVGCDVDRALRAGGTGLGGMRERLRLYGGWLEMRSAPGQGTRLRAVVPLRADAAPA